jgi:hypothetical protein
MCLPVYLRGLRYIAFALDGSAGARIGSVAKFVFVSLRERLVD